MKCPNCGYEVPQAPKPPYKYTGYLEPHLATILDMLRSGKTAEEIVHSLGPHAGLGPHSAPSTSLISYIAMRYGLRQKRQDHGVQARDLEIVRRHREGMRKGLLAKEYGLSTSRVSQIIDRLDRRERRRIEIEHVHGSAVDLADVPVMAMGLSVRTLGGLIYSGCETVGDVKKLADHELLNIPNFGRKSLLDWRWCLRQLEEEFDKRTSPGALPHPQA